MKAPLVDAVLHAAGCCDAEQDWKQLNLCVVVFRGESCWNCKVLLVRAVRESIIFYFASAKAER